ncbi:hypothetical protein TWF694_005154 [Orbilia ellipsospora]|uniref:Uncharacterized protein n=1 Tax=Orbilia ellipsospora TaxID=2528407 RepID=A0AAV9WUW0_9PEZI
MPESMRVRQGSLESWMDIVTEDGKLNVGLTVQDMATGLAGIVKDFLAEVADAFDTSKEYVLKIFYPRLSIWPGFSIEVFYPDAERRS